MATAAVALPADNTTSTTSSGGWALGTLGAARGRGGGRLLVAFAGLLVALAAATLKAHEEAASNGSEAGVNAAVRV